MILLNEINTVAQRFKVPAEVIEKDYIIGWILICLTKSVLKKDFVFYGGTAIKKIYFEDHRFSEDIDLLSKNVFPIDQIFKNFSTALKVAKDKINLSMEINPNRITYRKDRVEIFVQYSGYDEIIGSPKEVRIDIAMGMELYGEVDVKKVIKTYSDIKTENSTLQVQTLNTILAGKIGLLMDITRKEPRDIFDIWFLLNRSNLFDFSNKKVEKFFKEKYGFPPNWNILRSHLHSTPYRERWDIRLKKQIAELPPLKTVIMDIEDKIEVNFKVD